MYTCSVLVSVRQCSSAEISQIDVCFSKNLREAPTLKEYSRVFRHDPYGGGGWQKVERKPAQAPVNLGLPAPRVDRLAPVVQAEPDRRLEIKEKTVESLGLSSSSSYGTKPVINFRKRKNNAVRQREDDD